MVLAGAGRAQVTERVSVGPGGVQASSGGDVTPGHSLSADGRYVLFMSAFRFHRLDNNGNWDVFARDRLTGWTEVISVSTSGDVGNSVSGLYGMTITPDGRYVAFESRANNLVSGDTNGSSDIFLRDRQAGTTERMSVATGGTQGNAQSWLPSISPDGRYVAFTSFASNLVQGDTNGAFDVFVRDRWNSTTERMSVGAGGAQGNGDSYQPVISADGRFVAFESFASNLVPGDTNGFYDIFVRDRVTGTTERVSVSTAGVQANGECSRTAISADGRFVAFGSLANNLVPGDTNGFFDVFLRDRVSGTIELVSTGVPAPGNAGLPSLSPDGRYVAFVSGAGVCVRDRQTGSTEVASVAMDGSPASAWYPTVSPDGRYVSFRSYASNLVAGDTNTFGDVFVRDRAAAGFASLCEPGVDGVAPCPCSNPASGPERGCNNSSGTGGAALTAAGIAYLSMDSLAFTTTGQTPSATSILLQGDAVVPTGAVFGQGVRCAGGSLKRLFVKSAAAGGIVAPELGAGDPTVSTRSAILGDPILPGQSRYYLVFYRDPLVLGGCPAASTFNATQTGRVSWWP